MSMAATSPLECLLHPTTSAEYYSSIKMTILCNNYHGEILGITATINRCI